MSSYKIIDKKCGACGQIFKSRIRTGTVSIGSPDLDFRPPELERSSQYMLIDECPFCGYAHLDIEKTGKKHQNFIKQKDYINCENIDFISCFAKSFYKYGLIALNENDLFEAYSAFLNAAWQCDDKNDYENAILCRKKAISIYDEKLFGENEYLILRQIDLLRRVKSFNDAIALCDKLRFKKRDIRKIVKLQKKLSLRKDCDCHTIGEKV